MKRLKKEKCGDIFLVKRLINTLKEEMNRAIDKYDIKHINHLQRRIVAMKSIFDFLHQIKREINSNEFTLIKFEGAHVVGKYNI
jgi:hypothetical protein